MKKQHLSSIGQVKGTGTWAPASWICVRIIETMHTKLSSPRKHTRFGLWRICPRPKSSRDQKSTEPCCCPSSFALHLHLRAFLHTPYITFTFILADPLSCQRTERRGGHDATALCCLSSHFLLHFMTVTPESE